MNAADVADWLEASPRGRLQVFSMLEERGVTVTHVPIGHRGQKILDILDRSGPLPTPILAARVGIKASRVWSALRHLENRGLVRQQGPGEHPGGVGRSPTLWESVR